MADTLRSERSPRNRVGVQIPLLALSPIPILDVVESLIREVDVP